MSAAVGAGDRFTVTFCVPSFSDALDDALAKLTCGSGGLSSSVIEIVSGVTVRSGAVPVTRMVSVVSAAASSTGVRVNSPLPLAAPAAMVMSKFDTAT